MELDPAVCYLKPEYKVVNIETSEKDDQDKDDLSEPPAKKQKSSKKGGQNKHRPVFKEAFQDKLCRSLILDPDAKCPKEKCPFSHDIKSYMEKKASDIADKCYIFSTKGFCPYGMTCRFGKEHITETFHNINNSTGDEVAETHANLSYDLQAKLHKKSYSYSKADTVLKEMEELMNKSKNVGSCGDIESVVVRSEEKKKIDFRNKLVLSPLTTVGNLPFRRICKEYGADVTVGEMACSLPIINGANQEWALTKRHSSEDIFGVQIEGNNAKIIAYATQALMENADIDFIDLNIGCPIDLIFRRGGGSALIRRQHLLEHVVRTCSTLLGERPFTVKTRTGIYSDKLVADTLIPKLEMWGASAVTLHGRTKEQRYTKSADWDYIEECASKVERIPIIGNGDIYSFEDYELHKKNSPHVSSHMIGRGALIKPWIFKEIKEGKAYDISSKERFEILQKYANYGLQHWGSDTKGVETTRRFLLEWQSFLYRYVPYSLLQYPPQKINQRPETDSYLGRDDLESLMKSNKSSDWVKISEMFLGKVPEGFTFLPKHKANAY